MTYESGKQRLRIEIAPSAWTSIGLLPSDAFRRLRRQLEALSEEDVRALASATAEDGVYQLTVALDGLKARCAFDAEGRRVTLIGVETVVASTD